MRNADKQHFLFFPQCFLAYQRKRCSILATVTVFSANSSNVHKAKTLTYVNYDTSATLQDS